MLLNKFPLYILQYEKDNLKPDYHLPSCRILNTSTDEAFDRGVLYSL